ncbi:uncharacterized protein LOC119967831 isoform X2 [Scyliorhinus canicula]|uniref:uncharacterized protein LOC119967831 isoform X2 n=1 Tax=Scyliorhinus canicula TaxID=7830 RepID=UPI0018F7014C|nr:uncharacterized protein LOC119967831 isoform X2 [Scyliorhinus canicula]
MVLRQQSCFLPGLAMGDSPTSDPMDLRPSRPVSSAPAPSPSPSLTPPFPPTSSNPIPPSTSPSSPSVSVSPSLRSDSPFPHTSNKDFAEADEKIEVELQELHQKEQRQHAVKHSQSDLNSVFTEFLIKFDDYQLFKLMKFYWDRLEQAIEEGVDGISMLLTDKSVLSAQEYQKITELVEKGNRADSSKLLLNLVMEKGSLARRVMWESFVKMRHGVPKLDKILKVIQELGSDPFGYMDIAHDLSELSSHLKGKK